MFQKNKEKKTTKNVKSQKPAKAPRTPLVKVYRNHILLFLAGCVLGIICFGMIYGFHIVNPTYDDWIYKVGGDKGQHYLGWKFYRRTDWTFPIGLLEGLTSEGAVSCMFTDSIPIFAVFFKLLSPILPDTFQYLGLWELMSFALQGGLSALLIHKYSKSPAYCLVGSIPFIIAPTIILRAFRHEALSGQWLIMIALLLWAYREHKWRCKATPVILWSILGALSALIHIYFVPMIYMIMAGYMLCDFFKDKKLIRPILVFIATTLSTLLFLYIIGAFYGDGELKAGGLGIYSSNYNAFFNSYGYSKFLKPLNSCNDNTEGLGYLGFGVILMGFMAIPAAFSRLDTKDKSVFASAKEAFLRHRCEILSVIFVIFASMFLGASPKGTLNGAVIYEINYPDKIVDFLSIFRASGRFIWVADFIIYTAVLAVFAKVDRKKTALLTVSLCTAMQCLDLRDWFRDVRELFTEPEYVYECRIESEEWDKLTDGKSEIVFTPLPPNYLTYMTMYYEFAEMACEKGANLSSFYLARADYERLRKYAQEQLDELNAQNGRDDVLYVFMDKENVPEDGDYIDVYELDGYTVAVLEK